MKMITSNKWFQSLFAGCIFSKETRLKCKNILFKKPRWSFFGFIFQLERNVVRTPKKFLSFALVLVNNLLLLSKIFDFSKSCSIQELGRIIIILYPLVAYIQHL